MYRHGRLAGVRRSSFDQGQRGSQLRFPYPRKSESPLPLATVEGSHNRNNRKPPVFSFTSSKLNVPATPNGQSL
jgi:hypothetical protein